ncbi:MAG: hypothetical protein ABSH20_12275 [Tepidisphaeraceae bacterium]|jgi:hypothetical protein
MNLVNLRIINFAHEEDGVFTHGTISTLDGSPKVSWTFGEDGGEFTTQRDLEDEDLDALWDAFNEPVFRKHLVRHPDAELDFRTNHLVGIIFNIRGEAGRFTYLIPVGERDPVWTSWLRRMEATQHPG